MLHLVFLAGAWLTVIAPGCKRAEEPAPADEEEAPVAAVAPIVGTVLSPNGTGVDVVPGASVRIAGQPAVETDSRGQFLLPGAPIGEPVQLVVEGPRAFDPEAPERFGTQRITVTVPDEGGTTVYPHLLRACGAILPQGGGEVSDDDCAGAGAIGLTFGADAFDRPVEVTMVALDPDAPGDLLGLPSDGLGAAGPPILGAMEVHLYDAATGDPIAMAAGATATLRLELAPTPEGVDDGELVFEFYDPEQGVYGEPHPVSIVMEGPRRFGEVTLEHFSRGIMTPANHGAILSECVTFDTEVCRPSGNCDDSVPSIHVVDLQFRRAFVPEVQRAGGEVCIPLRAAATYDITFRWADAFTATLIEEPVYQTKIRHVTPPLTAPPGGAVCPDDCVALNGGRTIRLAPLPYGCVRAQLFSSGGDPVVGPIKVLVDGDHVSSAIIPGPGVCTPECENEFCTQVPVLPNGGEVEIQGANGANLQFIPDPSTIGTTCPRTRTFPCAYCDGAGGCQDLGAIVSDCDTTGELNNPCLQAEFDVFVTPDGGNCTGDTNLEVVLVGSRSTGVIKQYEWWVDRLDGVDPADNRQISNNPYSRPICAAPGEYVIRLTVYEAGRSWSQSRRDEVVQLGGAHPGPCSEVKVNDLQAPTPSLVETCTYTWEGTEPRFVDCVNQVSDSRHLHELTWDCGFHCNALFAFPNLPGFGSTRAQLAAPSTGPFTSDTVFTLDGFGNVVTQTVTTDTTTDVRHYIYDDPARPTRVEERVGGSAGTLTGSFALTWDGQNVSQVDYDHGDNGDIQTTYTYTYANDRLVESFVQGGLFTSTWHYAYDGAGNLVTITQDDTNGTPAVQRQFLYDCW